MDISTLWPYHAVLMILGFLLLLSSSLIQWYFKRKRWWLKAHKMTGILGAILFLAGLLMANYMVSVSTGVHFRVPHAYLGAFIILLIVTNLILGYAQLKFRNKAAQIRSAHRWSARIALVLILINILFGLLLVGIL
jgi:hypothetical protein